MNIIGLIVVGLIVGALAKLFMPGRDPGGFIITILLGIAGSLVGGAIGRALHLYTPGEPAGWIVSILGAMVLLLAYRMIAKPSTV
jgi:uncharacterized membrane protein YeaQ/YmgE (transglycosylase-associated protein family)